MMRISTLPALLVAAACASAAPPASTGVRVAEPGAVGACTRVGTMNAVPTVYGILAERGIADARRAVLEGAAGQGANTVVFERVEPGTLVTEVRATTYRC